MCTHATTNPASRSSASSVSGALPVALDLVAKLPDLPTFRNSYPDTALLFGGAWLRAAASSRSAWDSLGSRTFTFTTPPPADPLASVTRVVFTLDLAKAAAGFRLPMPTGTFGDRTFFTGMTTGARSPFFVQQVRLNDDPASATGAPISFQALVELNSTSRPAARGRRRSAPARGASRSTAGNRSRR